MSKYILHGLVLPERANVFIPKLNCSFPDKKIEIILECSLSKIVAECSSVNDIELLTLKNYIETAIRNIVDSIGYSIACGYDVTLGTAYNLETKELTIFGVHENIFNEAKINDDTEKGIPHPDLKISSFELSKLCGKNIELQIALSDFREAIRQPSFTSFHCYRAIEALRHVFGDDEQKQWEELRNTLQVDRSDIALVQVGARPLRHGESAPQPWEDRKCHMLITWQIIKKYIDWRLKTEASKSQVS